MEAGGRLADLVGISVQPRLNEQLVKVFKRLSQVKQLATRERTPEIFSEKVLFCVWRRRLIVFRADFVQRLA